MRDIYLIAGQRTPFVKAGGAFAAHEPIAVSTPVVQAMAKMARPDFLIWGQVIPSPTVSNIGRELLLEAGLDPTIPAFSTILACSTSMVGAIQAAGMMGHGGAHLALVGGVETMSHIPIALHQTVSDRIAGLAARAPAEALTALQALTPADFNLPMRGWSNRISGRSMGEHTEDTAKYFAIARADQDRVAYQSHRNAVAGHDKGFFSDLIIPFAGVDHDTMPRRDSTIEKLSTLPPVFDRSSTGTLTAGNSSPLTDGAAGLWVADQEGKSRLAHRPAAKLLDWQLCAMDWREEGILMAPARAIPQLLARHRLKFSDIALWEIHEAFAAQVLANIKAISDPAYRRDRAGVDADLGAFPYERLNPNGGSLAIGHPFAATGARILSQAVKELAPLPSGSKAIVSVCADGAEGSVVLLETP